MKINKLIFAVITLSVLLGFAIESKAGGYDWQCNYGCNGADGMDGTNGIDGKDGVNASTSAVSRAVSINAAMSNIPEINHINGHSHTNAGIGLGFYDGERALAIGVNHMAKEYTLKASLGMSGSERIVGMGFGLNF